MRSEKGSSGHQDQSPDPHLVYVVCGAEAFLKREAINAISDRALAGADRALALTEYDGASAALALAEVLDELRTLPFLAPRRLVIVRNADPFITRYRQELEDYAEKPSPTGVLLIECKSLPANTRLYKRVQAVGQVIKCDAPKRSAIPAWLVSRSRETYNLPLDRAAAAMLCDLVGPDIGLLDGELLKLSLYVGGRGRITTADVESAVGQHREEQVWGILSAVAAGNEARAMTLWEEVWQTD
ncbi:MAG: DNA polymerase III subunit delta, partial [Phycisphaerae bacterium]|nr:DNA polymerase III subunit delta [Phycisphaerae bacterium]